MITVIAASATASKEGGPQIPTCIDVFHLQGSSSNRVTKSSAHACGTTELVAEPCSLCCKPRALSVFAVVLINLCKVLFH